MLILKLKVKKTFLFYWGMAENLHYGITTIVQKKIASTAGTV